jgi:hypothetical protein
MKCPKCNHEWDYKGTASFATCPSCLSKVKVFDIEEIRRKAALAYEQVLLRLHTTSQLGDLISSLEPKLTRKVTIIPAASKIKVIKDEHFTNTYVIDFPLDFAPNNFWRDIFEHEWKLSRDLWDRKLVVFGKKIRLITTLDDIEEKFDWVKKIIEQTNNVVDEYYQKTKDKKVDISTSTEQQAKKQMLKEKVGVKEIKKMVKRKFS